MQFILVAFLFTLKWIKLYFLDFAALIHLFYSVARNETRNDTESRFGSIVEGQNGQMEYKDKHKVKGFYLNNFLSDLADN